jgi:hypothetical protein
MSNENPDSERRPRPEVETLIERRSASHAALEALELVETGAGITLGGLVVADVYAKAKDALGSKDAPGSKGGDSKD